MRKKPKVYRKLGLTVAPDPIPVGYEALRVVKLEALPMWSVEALEYSEHSNTLSGTGGGMRRAP